MIRLASIPLLLALAACDPMPAEADQTTAAAGADAGAGGAPLPADLETRFRAAATDASRVVPLIVEASARLRAGDAAEAHAIAERLEPLCRRVFFGPEDLPSMADLGVSHRAVKKGESLAKIAKALRVDHPLLQRLNPDVDAARLTVGRKLKVVDLSDRSLELVIDKERFRLAAWRTAPGGSPHSGAPVLVAYLPVGLGAADTPTPSGTTRITLRVRDPEWTDPETGIVYAPKDEGNVLGGYWMALDAEGIGQDGIGLHGYTGKPAADWIGLGDSRGCVRMLQDDIDRVFHLAAEGTPVRIVP